MWQAVTIVLDRLFVQAEGGGGGKSCRLFGIHRGSAVHLRYHLFLGFEGKMEMRRLKRLGVERKRRGGREWIEVYQSERGSSLSIRIWNWTCVILFKWT